MLKNPFDVKETQQEETASSVTLEKNELDTEAEKSTVNTENTVFSSDNNFTPFEFSSNSDDAYTPVTKKAKLNSRSTESLSDEAYHERVKLLNENAENKHYVLFFGTPASGKTWIIGSVLHYMKNYLNGVVYLDSNKTTETEEELFYLLQDRFNGVVGAERITSTNTHSYFELHISFTPNDKTKPPIEMVFVDASGEHSEEAFYSKDKDKSGNLPNYLIAILESNVKTKIAFVYDQSLSESGKIPQMNVLNEVFTKVQYIQNTQEKKFPKVLLLSKADKIYATDMAAVERNGYDPMNYALDKIPSFANSFFNESLDNKTMFYKMGKFSVNSDLLTEFDKECPEIFFNWLYKEGVSVSIYKELTCWDKFKRWFSGK